MWKVNFGLIGVGLLYVLIIWVFVSICAAFIEEGNNRAESVKIHFSEGTK